MPTKGEHLRPGNGTWYVDGSSPKYVKQAAHASLKRFSAIASNKVGAAIAATASSRNNTGRSAFRRRHYIKQS